MGVDLILNDAHRLPAQINRWSYSRSSPVYKVFLLKLVGIDRILFSPFIMHNEGLALRNDINIRLFLRKITVTKGLFKMKCSYKRFIEIVLTLLIAFQGTRGGDDKINICTDLAIKNETLIDEAKLDSLIEVWCVKGKSWVFSSYIWNTINTKVLTQLDQIFKGCHCKTVVQFSTPNSIRLLT